MIITGKQEVEIMASNNDNLSFGIAIRQLYQFV